MVDYSKLSRIYIYQTIAVMVAFVVAAWTLIHLGVCQNDIVTPFIVSGIYTMMVEVADACIWKKVTTKCPDSLPTFFMAVSGFRMLIAIAVLLVCWMVVGREMMLTYGIVLMCFYFAMLMHHSLFFAHISNSHSKCEK